MEIEAFFDKRTCTLTYVAYDSTSKDAVVIDPVLDYDPIGSRVFTESAERVIRFINSKQLIVHYMLETHLHADHLSGSQVLKGHFPDSKVAIGTSVSEVQKTFKRVFNLPDSFPVDGSQFDRLLADQETFSAGALTCTVISTPGHTPACVTYKIEDAIFSGDAIFMPDCGTGRCDFPGGSAKKLYDSITERLYGLPDNTRVLAGHDYQPGDRELRLESTIREEKLSNIHLPAERKKSSFVAFRNQRDETMNAPRLIYQSIQVNINAGVLPLPEADGQRYFKLPINSE